MKSPAENRCPGIFRGQATKPPRGAPAEFRGFVAWPRNSLVKFMTEGPIIVMALERDNAIAALREVMGATNPAKAAEGTIRKRFATNIERNCIQGSDAPETAAVELGFFFSAAELL